MNKAKFIDDKYKEFSEKTDSPIPYKCAEHYELACKECVIKAFFAQMMNEYDELKTK